MAARVKCPTSGAQRKRPPSPEVRPRYTNLKKEELPATESLEDTLKRVVPYWKEMIVPAVMANKKVMIAAHGNSIRALVKYLDKVPDGEITDLNIPTGFPLIYELDDSLHPVRHYYLGDEEEIRHATESVAGQATTTGDNAPIIRDRKVTMTGIFKAYDIRGSYPAELDEKSAEKIGSAFARVMKYGTIAVGRDARLSSPALASSFIRGFVGAGGHVTDLGLTSSPLLLLCHNKGEV